MNSLPRTRISTFRRQAEHGLFIDPADVVLLGKGSEVLKFRRKSDSGVQTRRFFAAAQNELGEGLSL